MLNLIQSLKHLFSLQQALVFYDFIKQQMLLCEREIEETLAAINGKNDEGAFVVRSLLLSEVSDFGLPKPVVSDCRNNKTKPANNFQVSFTALFYNFNKS